MKLWGKHLRAKWFQGDGRSSKAKARFLPHLEELERREAPVSLFNPLFASLLLSLDQLDAPYAIAPGDGTGSGSSGQGGGNSGGNSGSQGGSGGGSGGSASPATFTPADPAAAASTVNDNANLFDSTLGDDASNFAAQVAAAVGGQGQQSGQSGGTAGVGASVVIGLATPAAPPTSPTPPADAPTGPAPAIYPAAGTSAAVGQSLSPSQFGLNPFTLMSGATVGALTPFLVGAGMSVPSAHSGGGTTISTGADANNIGYTRTTIDAWAFNATLTPDANGGLTYEETYNFQYDVQTVPAAAGGASIHDWGASGYTFIANDDNGQYSFTLSAALTADEVGSQTVTTSSSSSGGPSSTMTTTWKSESQYDRTVMDTTNPATGAATGSDSGGGVTTRSSSSTGTYSRPISVGFGSGTVSGSSTSYSGQGTSYQFAIQDGLSAAGAVSQSGTWQDASGGYSGDWYSGSGSYSVPASSSASASGSGSGSGSASAPATADATPVPSASGGPFAPGATITGGGVYTESGADSAGYGYSNQYTLQNNGSWQASSGSGSSSGSGWTQTGFSGSGGYGYAVAGGSVSGSWQQSGGAETNYSNSTNSTFGASGWTQTGTSSSGDAGWAANSYQGSGSYVVNSAAASASGSGSGSGSGSSSSGSGSGSGSGGGSSSGSGSGSAAPPPAVDASPAPSASGGGPYASGAAFTGTGGIQESESDASGYTDNSSYTLASGAWQPASASGWTSGSGSSQWAYSASGGYGYAIAGGSVSGSWQQSGSASTYSNTNTQYNQSGSTAPVTTGSSASGDGGMQSDSYSGSGGYAVSSPAVGSAPPAVSASTVPSASGGPSAPGAWLSGAGLINESGSHSSGYGDSSQYTLASGSWQQTAGAGSTNDGRSTQWGYSASGSYGYAIAGGSVSGSWRQSGSAGADASTATNSTWSSGGGWTTTGTKSSGEAGGQHIGYSGSGNYNIAASGSGSISMSGSGSITESGTDDWGYGYMQQTGMGSGGSWLPASGSGGTTETESNSWNYSASGGYTRPMGGGALSGTWQAGGGSGGGYTADTTAALNPNGSWTVTGLANTSGSGSGLWQYSGSGSYSSSSGYGDSQNGGSSSVSSQATENYGQGWSSQYAVVSTLAATGLVTTVTTASASGSASGAHTYSSGASSAGWSSSGDYGAGNGSASDWQASSGVSLSESLQSAWQEGYTITSLPGQSTTTVGGSSQTTQASGSASSFTSYATQTESANAYGSSGSDSSSASDGQDNYDDQSGSWHGYAADGTQSSGYSSSDRQSGTLDTQWGESNWWTSPGSGSGSGTSGSASSGWSCPSSYDEATTSPGFGGMTGVQDAGWTWGVGWAGAGADGPLGPSAYSGLGYAFAQGDVISLAPVDDQSAAEGQAVSIPVQATDPAAGAGTAGGSGSGSYSAQNLPQGLSIAAQTGLLSGTIAEGDYTRGPLYVSSVTYTNAAGDSATESFVWLVADPLMLTNPGDQRATEGQGVNLTLNASDANGSGAGLGWTETGLPNGLGINAESGAISGAPAAGTAGVYPVTVTVTDAGGAGASQTFLYTVSPAVSITDPGVQTAAEGASVNLQIRATDATDGTLTFSADDGLPPGLVIGSGGDITGTISAGDAANGPYVATITATDGTYSATLDVTWIVNPAVSVTDPAPQSNSVGGPVSLQLQATDSTGGAPTFTAAGLPPGLQISSGGLITGSPTADGSYQVTVTASDGVYSGSDTFGWQVGPAAMTDPGDQTATQGGAVSLQVQATDAESLPLDYSADDLPPGLSINQQTGQITGTISPSASGFYLTTVTASDADFDEASQTFSWDVSPVVAVTDPGPQSGTEGQAVALQLQATDTAGGTPTFALTSGNLPPGLQISAGGLVSGTISAGAAAQGPYFATVTATDGAYSGTQQVFWSVSPALTIADPGGQYDLEGDPVNVQLQATDATGGTPTFAVTTGHLPSGLSISSSGLITGTINAGAAGNYQATVTATDGPYSATQTLTWKVIADPAGTWAGNVTALDTVFRYLGTDGRFDFDQMTLQAAASKAWSGIDEVNQPAQAEPAINTMQAIRGLGDNRTVLMAETAAKAAPTAAAPDFGAIFPGQDDYWRTTIAAWWAQLPPGKQQELMNRLEAVKAPRLVNAGSGSLYSETVQFQQMEILTAAYQKWQDAHRPPPPAPPPPPPPPPPPAPAPWWQGIGMSEDEYKTWMFILDDAATYNKAIDNSAARLTLLLLTGGALPEGSYRDDLIWPVTDEERRDKAYDVQVGTATIIEMIGFVALTHKVPPGLNELFKTEKAEKPVAKPPAPKESSLPPEIENLPRMKDDEAAFQQAFNKGNCFAAGTPLLTPDGTRCIDELRPGDLLLSRSESDPDGPLVAKVVEAAFSRLGRILHLHVGGEVIRTTREHPFWVHGRGWKRTGDLGVGDLLVSHDGQVKLVEDVLDTGEYETVYNVRVADFHTYFVGGTAWGFSVSAHNAECAILVKDGEDYVLKGRISGTEYKRGTEGEVRAFAAKKGHAIEEGLKPLRYQLKSQDLDWRGTGKTYKEALDEAFERTGKAKEDFEVTK